MTTARAVSAGGTFACALLANGTIDCWGDNREGSLGDGTTISRSTAAPVQGLSDAVAIAASNDGFACALLSSGSVSCWGNGELGQIGIGFMNSSLVPVTVPGIAGVTDIASGAGWSCAALSNGSVDCWGVDVGNFGFGSVTTPTPVVGLNGAIGIRVGDTHACALLSGGSAACWGADDFGELGDGTEDFSFAPVAVQGLTGVTSIRAGAGFTCASLSNGGASCWGSNANGELGIGTSIGPQQCGAAMTSCSTTAVSVEGLTGVKAATAGEGFGCALLSGGGVKCWGTNAYGELGIGTSTGPQLCAGFPCSTTAGSVRLF